MSIKTRLLDAENIFQKHGGLLRSKQARLLGINSRTIAEMCNANMLERLGRGLYRLTSLPPLEYPDFVQVAIRVPKAVLCLLSALACHNLTTEIPDKVYIALPQSVRTPQFTYPPLDVVWLSKAAHETGVEIHQLDGIAVPIYSASKTVTDCFKFRNKIGQDIAIQALRAYVLSPNVDFDGLLYHARINRIETILQPYLETML